MNLLFFEIFKIIFKIFNTNLIKIINYLKFLNLIIKYLKNKNKIKIKFGIDPTYKSIHIGHIYYFKKILNFIKFIKIINILFIISFWTNLNINFNYYKNITNNCFYIFYNIKFLFLKKLNCLKIYYNNDWNNFLSLKEKIFIFSIYKNNKLLNINKYKNFYIKNLYYIITQAYDSLFIKSNIEIGGFDQKMNFFFCYNFLKIIFKFEQIYFIYPFIFKVNFKKFSKSEKDNFFNIIKLILEIKKVKNKIIFVNYFKLILFENKNKINYLLINFNNIFLKRYVIRKITFFYFKKIILYFFKKLFLLSKLYSIIIFKIFKLFIINKFKYFKINNIILFNKNLLIFKGKYKIFFLNKFIYLNFYN